MPEMIPDEIPSHAQQAKKTIFETLKHSVPTQSEDWIIFHSIQIPQRGDSTNSRVIDFVILIPDLLCVICIIVKRNSIRFPWRKSDIGLARDIMEDLRSHFENPHFLADSPLSLGCAVVIPNTSNGVEIIVSNGNKYAVALDSLEDTLVDYAIHLPEVLKTLDKYGEEWDEAQKARYKLQSELDPANIPTETIFRDVLETSRRQLLRLTMDQLSSLRHVELNPRCVIDGAAGTGKSVLAKELAKRRCEEGQTVGLLCSNRYLSRDFEEWAVAISNESSGRIIAGTPATLPGKIFEEDRTLFEKHEQRLDASRQLEQTLRSGFLDDGWEIFINDTVNDLKQIIDNTDADPGKRGIFDYLIVDEAQNLCDEVFLKLMDMLLKHGLAEGKWTMFGDFIYQNIVTLDRDSRDKNDHDGRDVLADFGNGLHWSNDKLETNCRNTHEISDAVAKLLGINSLPRSGVHGPHVQIQLFDPLEQLNGMLDALISSWIDKGFNPTDIILLSSGTDRVFDDIVSEYGGEYGGWKLHPLSEVPEDRRQNSPDSGDSFQGSILRYSDIYDFQGLESNLAILIMPQTADEVELAGGIVLTRVEHLDRVLYTGMSRAHTMLVIFAHKSYQDNLKESWPDYDW